MKAMKLKLSIIQMPVAAGNPEENWARAVLFVQEAKRYESQVVLLPELWFEGYALERAEALASPLGEGIFGRIAALARENGLYVIGSTLERKDDKFYNTATIFTPEGKMAGVYRKVHLFAPMGERDWLGAGRQAPVFELPWGKTALAICYDLRFPELFRTYALKGAEVVFIPAQWPQARIDHWRLLLRARAVENQMFVVGCNRVGESDGTTFGGHSAIYGPWGELLVEGGEESVILTVTIDLSRVREVRESFPVLKDRCPEVYGR